jgi:hypothetical protein
VIRVNRNGGDFLVDGASVTMDGNLARIPEPATMGLVGLGLCAGLVHRTRRRAAERS